MICSDSGKLLKLNVAVVITLISFRLVSAVNGGFFSGTFHSCRYSACDQRPICPYNYDILTQTREGCPDSQHKKYCCPSGTGPQCFYTGCNAEACPENYRELDRTRIGCPQSTVKAYCCKKTNLPYCFDMTCPTNSETPKSCPNDYKETRRETGRSPACDPAASMRLTCCLHDNKDNNDDDNNDHGGYDNGMENGDLHSFTRSRGYTKNWRGMYSGGETAFAVFLKIMVLLPIIVAIL